MAAEKRKLGPRTAKHGSRSRQRMPPRRIIEVEDDDDSAREESDSAEDRPIGKASAKKIPGRRDESEDEAFDDETGAEEEDGQEEEAAAPLKRAPRERTIGDRVREMEKRKRLAEREGEPAEKATDSGRQQKPKHQREVLAAKAAAASQKGSSRAGAGAFPSRPNKDAPVAMPIKSATKYVEAWTQKRTTLLREPLQRRLGSSGRSGAATQLSEVYLAKHPPTLEDRRRRVRDYAFEKDQDRAELARLREQLAPLEAAVKDASQKVARLEGQRDVRSLHFHQARLEAATEAATELRRKMQVVKTHLQAFEKEEKAIALLEAQRQRERELVKQGKTPYFMKKSAVKQLALKEQFASMTDQQVDRAIDRRRKKLASRERRQMPQSWKGKG